MQEISTYITCPLSLINKMSNGRIVSVTDLDSLAGHYGVRFNALRWRALWGFNDRSHGTNPES